MAHQLPAGAPRVPSAKDSLARNYERLNRQPRRVQMIHNPFTADPERTSRATIAGYIIVGVVAFYVAIQVARALLA